MSKIPDVGGQISKVVDSLIFKQVTGQVCEEWWIKGP